MLPLTPKATHSFLASLPHKFLGLLTNPGPHLAVLFNPIQVADKDDSFV